MFQGDLVFMAMCPSHQWTRGPRMGLPQCKEGIVTSVSGGIVAEDG